MFYNSFAELIMRVADRCESTGDYAEVNWNTLVNAPNVGFSINNGGRPLSHDTFYILTGAMKEACDFWGFPEGAHQLHGAGKWGHHLLPIINTEEGRIELRRHVSSCRVCAIVAADMIMRV